MAFRTNIGGKFYIAVDSSNNPDPQTPTLSLSEFSALTYIQVPNMGSHGDTGVDQGFETYSTWDNRLAQKVKGEATGAEPEVRFADEPSTGLTAMKSAADITDLNNYAFKILWPDGQVEYNLAQVSAPSYPKGDNTAFAEAVFTLGINQEPEFDTESV